MAGSLAANLMDIPTSQQRLVKFASLPKKIVLHEHQGGSRLLNHREAIKSPKPPRTLTSRRALLMAGSLAANLMNNLLPILKQAWGLLPFLIRLKQNIPLKGRVRLSLVWDLKGER